MLQRCLSQEVSGACDAGQLPPDRLVLSITNVVMYLQLMDIRQDNIVPHSLSVVVYQTAQCTSNMGTGSVQAS